MLMVFLLATVVRASGSCTAGEMPVAVVNATQRTVTSIAVGASGAWSSNLLASTLGPDTSSTMCVPPGDTDVQVTDDTGQVLSFVAFTFKEGETFLIVE